MFEKPFEKRLSAWAEFRQELEESEEPFRRVVEFYNRAPYVSIHTDPWAPKCWPDPWELIYENQYDDFCRVLGMCYSLQLTERFKARRFEIHINRDNELGYTYLLYIDDFVVGYDDEILHRTSIPASFKPQHVYPMPPLQ